MTHPEIQAPGGTVRYLLVDDHRPFREMLAAYLPEASQVVAECDNGQAAVESFDALRPDCVLMDIEMPVLDGLDATRAILQRHPGARIIILTQHEEPELHALALGAGASAVFSKSDLHPLSALLASS